MNSSSEFLWNYLFLLQMVKLLLSRGANINAFDKKDRRAIHWAAYMGMYVLSFIFLTCIQENLYILVLAFGIVLKDSGKLHHILICCASGPSLVVGDIDQNRSVLGPFLLNVWK